MNSISPYNSISAILTDYTHTMFVVVAAVVVAAGPHCSSTPGGTYPAVVEAYRVGVRNASTRPVIHRTVHRGRRELGDAPVRNFPFSELNFVGSPGTRRRKIIQHAWQYTSALFTTDDDSLPPLTLVTNATPPADSPAVIGQFDGDVVYIYVDRVDGDDMLFLVTVHELFHWLAFYDVDVGAGSFVDRTSPENVYSGPRVGPCVNNVTVYTDAAVAHWRNDADPFSSDVMEPILPANGDAQISVCTSAAVVETRTSWTLMSCDSTAQCPVDHVCVAPSAHIAGVCIHVDAIVLVESEPPKAPIQQFPKLTAFIFGVFTAFSVISQCATRAPPSPASFALKPSATTTRA